jgi:SHS2 domain-containing protein
MKRPQPEDTAGYEYLDHTADIQLHSWAPDLKRCFELLAEAMFNYITELKAVEETAQVEVEAEGHDMESLLFSYMDELLFQFNGDYFVCKRVEIVEFDRDQWKIRAVGHGETYDKAKHVPGTEIKVQLRGGGCSCFLALLSLSKAITYSAMQIHETADKSDVYMIVDI